jgi:hypothetical protein
MEGGWRAWLDMSRFGGNVECRESGGRSHRRTVYLSLCLVCKGLFSVVYNKQLSGDRIVGKWI